MFACCLLVHWLPETSYGRHTMLNVQADDDLSLLVQGPPVVTEPMATEPTVEKNGRSTTTERKNGSSSIQWLPETSCSLKTSREFEPNDNVPFLLQRLPAEIDPVVIKSSRTTKVHKNEIYSALYLPETGYDHFTAHDLKPNKDLSMLAQETPVETEPVTAPPVAKKNSRSTDKVHNDHDVSTASSRKPSSRVTRKKAGFNISRSRKKPSASKEMPRSID
ncbi:hypothetical protein HPB51_017205 [Rhipicephalus microplus]|uniref:Uncharacterized protein n=1 Tax=Rhipicephalus microplus TaxID=6941 RepID=A0A9J6EB11_RHIMP|nr:hypothetical protein HPB51_017205 [Rhipicephalus microplus]